MPLFQTQIESFLDHLHYLFENFHSSSTILHLLTELLSQMTLTLNTKKALTQLVFYLEASLTSKMPTNLQSQSIIEKTYSFIKNLYVILEKTGMLFLFKPLTVSHYDLLSENNWWKEAKTMYLLQNGLCKEGGVFISFFNILSDFLDKTISVNDFKTSKAVFSMIDELFSEQEIEKHLEDSEKTYFEIFGHEENEGSAKNGRPEHKIFMMVKKKIKLNLKKFNLISDTHL